MSAQPKALTVCVLAYPGVDELDLFGAYVPLAKAAGRDGSRLRVDLVSAEDRVLGSNGVSLLVGGRLDTVERSDAVVVPGGRGIAEVAADRRYVGPLARARDRGIPLYAVCSGALLLAAAGVLSGHWVAVHHHKRDQLAAAADCHVTAGLVKDRGICSIGGETTRAVKGVDLGFQLLRDLVPDAVEYVSDRLETRPGPRPLERIG